MAKVWTFQPINSQDPELAPAVQRLARQINTHVRTMLPAQESAMANLSTTQVHFMGVTDTTATMDPQVQGVYIRTGTYNGQPVYKGWGTGEGQWDIWYNSTDSKWYLSAAPGDTTDYWRHATTDTLAGSYTQAGGSAVGTGPPLITAGTQPDFLGEIIGKINAILAALRALDLVAE